MARLDPHVQFEPAINPVDAFVMPSEAFDVMQVQEAQTEAPVTLVARQPYQTAAMTSFSASDLAL